MNYTIAKNEQYNSFEVLFDGKPSEAVRDLLKSFGYRWHGLRRVWYGYSDITEALKTGEKNATLAHTTSARAEQTSDKAEQAKLIDEYITALSAEVWRNDSKMLDYMRSNTARVYKTENGYLIAIKKPKIETSFCFGYGFCGVTTQEEQADAYRREEHARTNENYFIEKNTADLRRIIKGLEDKQNEVITYTEYSHHGGDDFCVKGFYVIENYRDREHAERLPKMEALSDTDRHGLIQAYKQVLKDFEKRLATYLKRYGLSKLHTWTYLSD